MLNRYFKLSNQNLDFMYANIAVKNIYFALVSLDYIFNHENFNYGIYHDEHTFYFFHIQSILTACGNICNVFYNPTGFNKNTTTRCARLRQTLNISKAQYPLIFQKEGRNTNEHFDERYEEFGALGDYNLLDNNTDQFMRDIITTNPHLRTYDKTHGIYYTYDRYHHHIEFDLHELQRELEKMRDCICNHELFNSAWVDSMPGESIT